MTPYASLLVPNALTSLQNIDLDRTQLSLCVSLIENGVNPEALAVRTFLCDHSSVSAGAFLCVSVRHFRPEC